MVRSLALLLASLVALAAGRFIQFDDTSGFGSHRWVMPLGVLAALLAVGAVAMASSDRSARRALGGALAGLDIAVVAGTAMDDGFRFIWGGDEGELLHLQVGLGLAALFLVAPGWWSTADGTRPARRAARWTRVPVYASAIVVGMSTAFLAGTAHFEATQCNGPDFGGECDLAVIEGVVWAGGALVIGLVAIVVVEVALARRGPSR